MSDIRIINLTPNDVRYLDGELLDAKTGRIRLLPASTYRHIDPVHLAVWASLQARYTFPTTELIDWLRAVIGGRKAIEIGAGNGDLGYHLGIPMSDSHCQQRADVKAVMEFARQAPTNPPSNVENLDAIEAVRKHKPQVVVGSWITQKYKDGPDGNIYGPEEEDILDSTECYIHIGNESNHSNKRIRRHVHQAFHFDWLVTRSFHPERNVIYVWDQQAGSSLGR